MKKEPTGTAKKTVFKQIGWKLLLMLSAFIWSAVMPAVSSAEWTIETLDTAKAFNNFSQRSIAIDSFDRPHIAYGGKHLYYAYFDGTKWRNEVVDNGLRVGKYASIAIDSNDKVHISYYDWDIIPVEGRPEYAFKYATNATGTWVIETISNEQVSPTSIAIDSHDNVHISYNALTNSPPYRSLLRYATKVTDTWVIKTLDARDPQDEQPVSGASPSLAIDSNDNVHISYYFGYYSGVDSYLKHITNASGAWVVEIIYDELIVGSTSLAIDSNDNLHIGYSTGQNFSLINYTTNVSGAWVVENVDMIVRVDDTVPGISTSIAVDSNNNAHIGYFNGDHGGPIPSLRYATNASGTWTVIENLNGRENIRSTSIAIDSSDNVHINYHDVGNRTLDYTTNASGAWVFETVDAEGVAGQGTSIAIDSNNSAHISYFDSKTRGPMYTTNASGAWVVESVDIEGGAGHESSIAVDSNDNVHIGYQGADGLRYATNASGAWVGESVDTEGFVRYGPSIAIDSNNNVHISYFIGGPADTLKYTTNATGGWVITTVDEGLIRSSSIALDSRDNVHISYSYPSLSTYNYDIKYAIHTAGAWLIETLDTEGNAGEFSSIAVDSNDSVHISYVNSSIMNRVMYITNAAGAWVVESIEAAGSVGVPGSSIAIDSNDNVHIGHGDSWGLSEITNASGTWVVETVDADRPRIKHLSIAIDSNDNVHFSYYTTDPYYFARGLDHKYATNALSVQTVSATAGSGGSISPAGEIIVVKGSDQTLTITPGKGYRISDVLVDDVSIGRVISYTFTNILSDHTIRAEFARKGKMHGRHSRRGG